jgi:hypothetical protein
MKSRAWGRIPLQNGAFRDEVVQVGIAPVELRRACQRAEQLDVHREKPELKVVESGVIGLYRVESRSFHGLCEAHASRPCPAAVMCRLSLTLPPGAEHSGFLRPLRLAALRAA